MKTRRPVGQTKNFYQTRAESATCGNACSSIGSDERGCRLWVARPAPVSRLKWPAPSFLSSSKGLLVDFFRLGKCEKRPGSAGHSI